MNKRANLASRFPVSAGSENIGRSSSKNQFSTIFGK